MSSHLRADADSLGSVAFCRQSHEDGKRRKGRALPPSSSFTLSLPPYAYVPSLSLKTDGKREKPGKGQLRGVRLGSGSGVA